jgi:hypothetical protein
VTSNKKIPKAAMKAAKIEVNVSSELRQKIIENTASGKGVYTRFIRAVRP